MSPVQYNPRRQSGGYQTIVEKIKWKSSFLSLDNVCTKNVASNDHIYWNNVKNGPEALGEH